MICLIFLFLSALFLPQSLLAQTSKHSQIEVPSNLGSNEEPGPSIGFEFSPPKAGDCDLPGGIKCDTSLLPANSRSKFKNEIVEAANEFGIEPALLLAQLHAETHMRPLVENSSEKKANGQNADCKNSKETKTTNPYCWGKGLGQFGANNAHAYGLDWYAIQPQSEDELVKICAQAEVDYQKSKQPQKFLFPIWCPKRAILAKAQYLREKLDKPVFMEVESTDSAGKPVKVQARIDYLYKRNSVETARYLAGMYNRGNKPIYSIREHYRQHKKLPQYYGTTLHTKRIQNETPDKPLLESDAVNLCHVYKIAGLCGDDAQGWLKTYRTDFVFDEKTSLWRSA